MALSDVYQKTVKGSAEIAARTIKIAPMTRMAMVMIDGVKPFSDLCSKLGGEAAAQHAVDELLGHGLIEVHAAAAGGVAADAAAGAGEAATATPVASTPAMPFEPLRKWASQTASKAMGPMGDDFCLRIERASNTTELNAAVERARGGIEGIVNSRAKADAYWNEYLKLRG